MEGTTGHGLREEPRCDITDMDRRRRLRPQGWKGGVVRVMGSVEWAHARCIDEACGASKTWTLEEYILVVRDTAELFILMVTCLS